MGLTRSETDRELDYTVEAVTQLESTINHLQNRLTLILREDPPSGEKCCDPDYEIYTSIPIVNAIHDLRERVNYATNRLSAVIDRLGI